VQCGSQPPSATGTRPNRGRAQTQHGYKFCQAAGVGALSGALCSSVSSAVDVPHLEDARRINEEPTTLDQARPPGARLRKATSRTTRLTDCAAPGGAAVPLGAGAATPAAPSVDATRRPLTTMTFSCSGTSRSIEAVHQPPRTHTSTRGRMSRNPMLTQGPPETRQSKRAFAWGKGAPMAQRRQRSWAWGGTTQFAAILQ